MIELDNITHYYGKNSALESVSLVIEAGKTVSVLGSSGSGKTTLLRLIAGLETPREGTIRINGKVVTAGSEILVPPYRRGAGFIFQDLALWPHFTIYRNVAFGLEERKEANVKEKVTEILDFLKLGEHAQKYPHQLSGGQKQLAAIARALVLRPQILLMDEPLANLDVKLKKQLLLYIKELKRKFGLTIVYVTHEHKEAFELADKIVIINNGKIEDEGSPEEIKNSENEYVKYFLEY